MVLSIAEITSLEEQTQELRALHSYENYLLTLRKAPTPELYEDYLKALLVLKRRRGKRANPVVITPKEKQAVNARRIWTNVVSEMDTLNQASSEETKQMVMQRLKRIKPDQNPEKLYQQCIAFLQSETVITVSIDASFLSTAEGLSDFQLLNMFEKSPLRGEHYHEQRDQCEKDIVQGISNIVKKEFSANLQARPRYGALQFKNKQGVRPYLSYGSSLIVLKEPVKYNALYGVGDSYIKHASTKFTSVCTLHHFEILLSQMDTDGLQAIIKSITTGSNQHAADYYGARDGYSQNYIEVMLPAINLLDPNLIEGIYIDSSSYRVPPETIEQIAKLGIKINNIRSSAHHSVDCMLTSLIRTHDVASFKELYKSSNLSAKKRDELVCLAIVYSDKDDAIFDYILQASPPDSINQIEYYLSYAVKQSHLGIVQVLLKKRAEFFGDRQFDGEGVMYTALHCQDPQILEALLNYLEKNNSYEIVKRFAQLPKKNQDLAMTQLRQQASNLGKLIYLTCAVKQSNLNVVQELLENNPRLITGRFDVDYVMHTALHCQNSQILEALLDSLQKNNSLELIKLFEQLPQKEKDLAIKQLRQAKSSLGQLTYCWLKLDKQVDKFKENKHQQVAYQAAKQLQSQLTAAFDHYLEKKTPAAWKEMGSQMTPELKKARQSELANHRGFKNVLTNIALFIVTLGVFYPVVTLTRSSGKHLFFKAKTTLIEVVDELEQALHNVRNKP